MNREIGRQEQLCQSCNRLIGFVMMMKLWQSNVSLRREKISK